MFLHIKIKIRAVFALSIWYWIDFITSEFETSRNIHHVFAYVMKMSPIASYCREKLPPYLCLCPYYTVYVTLYLLKNNTNTRIFVFQTFTVGF